MREAKIDTNPRSGAHAKGPDLQHGSFLLVLPVASVQGRFQTSGHFMCKRNDVVVQVPQGCSEVKVCSFQKEDWCCPLLDLNQIS